MMDLRESVLVFTEPNVMRACLLTLLLLTTCGTAHGEDVFLTIGGGYNAHGNQISLEKNVLLFQRMLEQDYGADVRHDVFFADGGSPGRDLQYVDPGEKIPAALRLLAELHDQDDDIDYQYRNHEVPDISGPSARNGLQTWFDETGSALAEGDRLFIYVTAHGGRSTDKEQPHDTLLYLWNRQTIRMRDFVGMLDQVPGDVPVVIVMVQCYSGGYSHTIFNGGDPENGLAAANRCGFFATVHDRVAAGCTADINEANYREYSTYFFEALRGRTRFDAPAPQPDYDGDGLTSLAEAHAAVILSSVTIDIPVCTSDALLREFSVTQASDSEGDKPAADQDVAAAESDSAVEGIGGQLTADEGELLTAESPYDRLIENADPIDRAIIDGLSEELAITEPNRAAAARAKADEFQKRMNELGEDQQKLQGEYNGIRNRIKRRVIGRWPELDNRWHPVTVDVLANHADELVELIESTPRYDRFVELREQIDDVEEAKFDQERNWVKTQRLLWALETCALAANLPYVASQETVDRFNQLRMAERTYFGPLDADGLN
ncbi:MAG: hypothetical protein DWQ34_08580 [Planctomycetota bacterium]|nr:MAG: hypothetical protein DWQ29_24100 [Planctomycetota bacterium]REJ94479.1 MAG: hypothetical protein DWQ34_08580 [Planctomycetota bacterium]REK22588.1 MAG: hypothetical protein DWQ41_19080 [Planctomycetota bacterium]REK35989.1 MAG: hypothetical protein DWQ45_09870 [Planctomycetota bacterium]